MSKVPPKGGGTLYLCRVTNARLQPGCLYIDWRKNLTNKKKLIVILILFSSTGCSGDDPYDLQQEISDLRQSISADKIAMGYKQIDCKYGKSNHVVEGKKRSLNGMALLLKT